MIPSLNYGDNCIYILKDLSLTSRFGFLLIVILIIKIILLITKTKVQLLKKIIKLVKLLKIRSGIFMVGTQLILILEN